MSSENIGDRILRISQERKHIQRVGREDIRQALELRKQKVQVLVQERGEEFLARLQVLGIPEILQDLKSFEQGLEVPSYLPKKPDSRVEIRCMFEIITPKKTNYSSRTTKLTKDGIWTEDLDKSLDNYFHHSGNDKILIDFYFKDFDIQINSISSSFFWPALRSTYDERSGSSGYLWREKEICLTLSKDTEGKWQLTLNDKPLNQLDRNSLEESVASEYNMITHPFDYLS